MSYKKGHIINTGAQNVGEYGVVQAPFGLSRSLRKSCAIRGGFTGNTPIDDNKKFDCSDVAPPPPPPPGNDDYYFHQGNVRYEYAHTPKVDFGSTEINLNQGSVRYEYAHTPKFEWGPVIVRFNQGSVRYESSKTPHITFG